MCSIAISRMHLETTFFSSETTLKREKQINQTKKTNEKTTSDQSVTMTDNIFKKQYATSLNLNALFMNT